MAPGESGKLVEARPLTVLLGHPRPQSRTRGVALRAAELLRDAAARSGIVLAEPCLVDLAELTPKLVLASTEQSSGALADAEAAVTRAGLLIVVSPTFKGTFSGLLKLFADVLPRRALRGTVALPLMTAADPRHAHAVESHLRPLLTALGAAVPVTGVCVLEERFGELDSALEGWSAEAVRMLHGLLPTRESDKLLTG